MENNSHEVHFITIMEQNQPLVLFGSTYYVWPAQLFLDTWDKLHLGSGQKASAQQFSLDSNNVRPPLQTEAPKVGLELSPMLGPSEL